MTILICIPCLMTGGTEIQTLNLVKALVSAEHRVVTACYFEYTPEMVARYKEAGSEVVLFEPEGKRIGGWRGARFLLPASETMRETIQARRSPCAVHGAGRTTRHFPENLLGVRKIIATAHTDARIYRSLKLLHFLQRHVLDAFTCITQRAEEEFFGSSLLYTENTPLPPHAHLTIHNALPEHLELLEPERVRASTSLTIGIASRLEKIKGMDLVIPAFAHLRVRAIPDARLSPRLGTALSGKACSARRKNSGYRRPLNGRGVEPQELLAAFYDRMDLFWMPSRSEGFGLSALEAMARGCPVIASDVGGLPELLQGGRQRHSRVTCRGYRAL